MKTSKLIDKLFRYIRHPDPVTRLAKVREYLNMATDLNYMNGMHQTLLMLAVQYADDASNAIIIDGLVSKGIDINYQDHNKSTAIFRALENPSNINTIKTLMKYDIDYSLENINGDTASTIIFKMNNAELIKNVPDIALVKLLLDCELIERIESINTMFKRFDLVEILMERGFDLNSKDEDGAYFVQIVEKILNPDDFAYVVKMIEYGGDVNAVDGQGYPILWNFLHNFLFYMDNETYSPKIIIEYLIEKDSNVNFVDGDGASILMKLVCFKHEDVIELVNELIEQNLFDTINTVDTCKNTALIYALRNPTDNISTIQKLLQRGATCHYDLHNLDIVKDIIIKDAVSYERRYPSRMRECNPCNGNIISDKKILAIQNKKILLLYDYGLRFNNDYFNEDLEIIEEMKKIEAIREVEKEALDAENGEDFCRNRCINSCRKNLSDENLWRNSGVFPQENLELEYNDRHEWNSTGDLELEYNDRHERSSTGSYFSDNGSVSSTETNFLNHACKEDTKKNNIEDILILLIEKCIDDEFLSTIALLLQEEVNIDYDKYDKSILTSTIKTINPQSEIIEFKHNIVRLLLNHGADYKRCSNKSIHNEYRWLTLEDRANKRKSFVSYLDSSIDAHNAIWEIIHKIEYIRHHKKHYVLPSIKNTYHKFTMNPSSIHARLISIKWLLQQKSAENVYEELDEDLLQYMGVNNSNILYIKVTDLLAFAE